MHVMSCAKDLATMIAVIDGSCFEVALVSLVPRESMDLCEIYKEKDDYISFEETKGLEIHAEWRHVGCLHVELHNEAARHVLYKL